MEDPIKDVRSIARAMRQSTSYPKLIRNWKTFSLNLGVDQVQIDDLKLRRNIGTTEANEIPYEILRVWIADQGTNATVKRLHGALIDSGLYEIAESLLEKFWKPESMRKVEFEWQGCIVTLEELLGESTLNDSYEKVHKELRKLSISDHIFESPIQLLKEQLNPPTQPKYYIPRTLRYLSTELNSELFQSDLALNNVFVFKGISKSDLTRLNGYQRIDDSCNQLHNVTERFIMLECEGDFNRICRNTSKPVHMIRYENGRIFWVKSSQGLDLIRSFLKDETKQIGEQELVAMIASSSAPCALTISDSPGMGKTMVLANLAEGIRKKQPQSIVLFIVLQEFVHQTHFVANTSSSALEAIAAYASSSQVAQLVLKILLDMKSSYQVCLFLDGYDEVGLEALHLADAFLNSLNELKNVKTIVTTRAHLRTKLEIIFKHLSYEILPFNESNQIDFLTNYWTNQSGAVRGQRLTEFVKQCLAVLEANLTDRQREIAGIPLQCMMLAEVYAEDAERASNLESLRKDTVKPASFFQMYERLIELKFARIKDQKIRADYKDTHVYEAIKLLFPEWIKIFEPLMSKSAGASNENVLCTIGLMEKSVNKFSPRFIHRTYAEYLLAEFVVKNLHKHIECVDLLFGGILGRKGTNEKNYGWFEHKPMWYYYELKYPVICYFIDLQMKEYVKQHILIEMLLPSKLLRLLDLTKFNMEDVCTSLKACSTNDLEWIFDYVTNVLKKYSMGSPMRDKYLKDLPHLVIHFTNNVTILEKVLLLTNLKFGVDMQYHTLKEWGPPTGDYIRLYDCTPLHVAFKMGKYNMVSFLMPKYGHQTKSLYDLLCLCLGQSSGQSKSILEDKLLIIDMLVQLDCGLIKMNGLLLERSVDLSLLQRLLEHGADINSHDYSTGTVLHTSGTKDTYTEYLRWALTNGFKLVNEKNFHDKTSIMSAIARFAGVDDEALNFFQQTGADFNAKDNAGDSVLFYALAYSNNVGFTRKIIEYGADVNHTNRREENAVHKVMYRLSNEHSRKLDAHEALSFLKLLDSKGFNGFDRKDAKGSTPYDLARNGAEYGEEVNKLLGFLQAKINQA